MPRPRWRLRAARLAAVPVLATAGFVIVVLPLVTTGRSGAASAEVAGALPDSLPRGRPADVRLAIDNTGPRTIDPVCLRLDFDPPVSVGYVVFQGLDRVMPRGDLVCGGKLTEGETLSLLVAVTASTPGRTTMTVRPSEGARAIGPARTAVVAVAG